MHHHSNIITQLTVEGKSMSVLYTEQHLLYICTEYSDLKQRKDFGRDDDLEDYFRQVIQRIVEKYGKFLWGRVLCTTPIKVLVNIQIKV